MIKAMAMSGSYARPKRTRFAVFAGRMASGRATVESSTSSSSMPSRSISEYAGIFIASARQTSWRQREHLYRGLHFSGIATLFVATRASSSRYSLLRLRQLQRHGQRDAIPIDEARIRVLELLERHKLSEAPILGALAEGVHALLDLRLGNVHRSRLGASGVDRGLLLGRLGVILARRRPARTPTIRALCHPSVVRIRGRRRHRLRRHHLSLVVDDNELEGAL